MDPELILYMSSVAKTFICGVYYRMVGSIIFEGSEFCKHEVTGIIF